jgi:hypothetical protein
LGATIPTLGMRVLFFTVVLSCDKWRKLLKNKKNVVYLKLSYSREDITTVKAEIWDFLEGICPSDVEYKR